MLPSPGDFNHATARVKLNGTYFWFDATIAYQRGPVTDLFYPDYQTGLVISDNTDSLTTIPYRDVSNQDIKEDFKVDTSGSGALIVSTAFKGSYADDIRSQFTTESIKDIMTDDQKFYAKYYENINADSLTYADDDSSGIFTTKEYYTLPGFWTLKDSVKKFAFFPFVIDNIIRRPKQKDRKMPFSLDFPSKYKEEVTIALPEEWHVTDAESHLTNSGFAYNSKFFCDYDHVHLVTDYETYKDNVSATETAAYFKDLDDYDNNNNFEITYDMKTSKDTHVADTNSSDGNLIFIIIIVVGIIITAIRWSQRK